MVRLPVRLFHRPPNEPPPEPPDDPPKPPPEKEPPEPPKLPEPPDEEDGAAAEIVLRTSAKLELSCAPRSPKFALNAAGSIVEAPSDVPTDAPSRLLERKGMYMYEVPACSSNHCGSATSGYALASWAIAFLEMPNAVAYTMYRPHNVMSSTPRSVKSLKSVR